jgi:Undecaprenyl-phosphate glucose phosphotransferase
MRLQDTAIRAGWDEYLADIVRLLDVTIMLVGAVLIYILRHQTYVLPGYYVGAVLFTTFAFIVTGQITQTYRFDRLKSVNHQILALATALFLSLSVLIGVIFYAKVGESFSRLWMGLWFVFNFIMMFGVRIGTWAWLRRRVAAGDVVRRLVLYGAGAKAQKIIDELGGSARRDIQVVGIFDPKRELPIQAPQAERIRQFKDFKEMSEFCVAEEVDDVILTADLDGQAEAAPLLMQVQTLPCNILYCMPIPFFSKSLLGGELIGSAPVAMIASRPLQGRRLLLKRGEDLVLGSLLLLLASPLLAFIGLLVKLSDGGPMLFKQRRHGFGGTEFTVYKFRTMTMATEKEEQGNGMVKQARRNDPRVTGLGSFLRRTSLDELPQLFNVVKGDMSLVGPRPHAVSHNEYYGELIDTYAARNKMKPGITGWAQVCGYRGETDTLDKMARRVEHDINYIENWSLLLDLKILALTALTVFFHRSAY